MIRYPGHTFMPDAFGYDCMFEPGCDRLAHELGLPVKDPADIADTIRAEIRERGETQAGFARHLGYSEKHLSQLLNGKAGMNVLQLLRIMECLDVDVVLVPRNGRIDGETNDDKRAAT